MNALPLTHCAAAELYIRTLTADAPAGALLDVRYRTKRHSLARIFIDAKAPDAASAITKIGRQTDVYVGCAMRVRRRGTRQDLAPTPLLWADCDTPRSLVALATFEPSPTMIVASGSSQHAHAYWTLTQPLPVDQLEHVNRHIANVLGADQRCADAARILRPPDTLNFKHSPPRPVELIDYSGERHNPEDIITALSGAASRQATDRPRHLRDARREDPLQQIKPAHYIRLLTGQTPGPDRKIVCPFHDDRTPSLHVYETPEEGWACYGCPTADGKPVGGDIYTFASLLWHIPARGPAFIELRARLDDVFRIRRDRPA